jgi:hypothetical protein
MVTDSDESITKSLDYVVQPVVLLPKTGSFLMEVDESSGPETISVLALVSKEEQAIPSAPSSSLVVLSGCNKYAMESRATCSLLDNIVSTCESQLLCHAGYLGCKTQKEYKDFPTRWMLDLGASAHSTSHLEDFSDIQMGNFGIVQTASKLEPMLG